jgi:hypothetical protein
VFSPEWLQVRSWWMKWHWSRSLSEFFSFTLLLNVPLFLHWLINWLWWGEIMSQNCGHQRAYCSSPGWYVSMENSGDDDAGWGITPDSSIRTLWQSYQQTHLGQLGGIDKGVRILPIHYLRYFKGSFTCRKILRHGTSGLTSRPKEGVLRIFIALKNPSPRPSLNPRLLGPVANTLTTTHRLFLYTHWSPPNVVYNSPEQSGHIHSALCCGFYLWPGICLVSE